MSTTMRGRLLNRRLWAGAAGAALLAAVCGAYAQSTLGGSPLASPWGIGAPSTATTPPLTYARPPGATTVTSEPGTLREALAAARSGDTGRAQAIEVGLSDPVAKRLVEWAMIDQTGTKLDFFTVDRAQSDLDGWPRSARRQAVAEKAMQATALPPSKVIAWFAGREPTTPEGAMALAAAQVQSGRAADAQALIKRFWRGHAFAADAQAAMLARYGIYLTPDDHAARLSMLLYDPPSPAARAMLPLVSADQRAVAEARLAFRGERSDANQRASMVPYALQGDPGLAFDHARYLRKHNLDTLAVNYLRSFPTALPATSDAADQVWTERRALMTAALKSGDVNGAYAAVNNHGLTPAAGQDYTEAEFFAGWVALSKLHNPALADQHFARLLSAAQTPVTTARADYWRGRAAAARGDVAEANAFWSLGARYYTTFYGQLSAEKVGQTRLTLGPEPVPTAEDRASFESRDLIRAARLLGDAGDKEFFRAFVLCAAETLPTADQLALLIDMTRLYGDQDTAMRAVRAGAMRGLFLPQRGYPLRTAPQGYGLPEPAFTLAIIRQESGFDPYVRSPVGARGLMQLMPGTASVVARKIGVGYSPGRLDEGDYNVRLGSSYLGQITGELGGSYTLAAAGYNAGPGRAEAWAATCGDPRQASVDPADFIECIPIAETRNYVMRVMENLQVYRARLAGGSAPLTLTADLHRGGWTPHAGGVAPLQTAQTYPAAEQPLANPWVQTR